MTEKAFYRFMSVAMPCYMGYKLAYGWFILLAAVLVAVAFHLMYKASITKDTYKQECLIAWAHLCAWGSMWVGAAFFLIYGVFAQ